MEATLMPIDRWMDKEIVVHIYNGILSNKKELIWFSWTEVNEPRACYTEWYKSDEKDKYHIVMHNMEIRKIVVMGLFV